MAVVMFDKHIHDVSPPFIFILRRLISKLSILMAAIAYPQTRKTIFKSYGVSRIIASNNFNYAVKGQKHENLLPWRFRRQDDVVVIISSPTSLQFPTTQNISMLTGSLAFRSDWSPVELLLGFSGRWFWFLGRLLLDQEEGFLV